MHDAATRTVPKLPSPSTQSLPSVVLHIANSERLISPACSELSSCAEEPAFVITARAMFGIV